MITEDYFMQLVRNYAKSPAGRKAIKEKYGVTYAPEFSPHDAKYYGEMMKKILYQRIHPLISSIEMDDIIVGSPTLDSTGKYYTIHVGFAEGSLHRESLYPEGYPHGLDNIILLFAHGYNAKDAVHGSWQYHGKTIREDTWSKTSREPNSFLDDAVAEFDKKAKGIAIAILEDEYE